MMGVLWFLFDCI